MVLNNKNKDSTGVFKNGDEVSTEELERELIHKENEIRKLEEKLADTFGRLHDVVAEKKLLQQKINEGELQEIDLKFKNFNELQDNYHKLEHRTKVTKKQLDDVRARAEFQERVIEDLENRGFLDFLFGRIPESFRQYKKNVLERKGKREKE
jgi:chromosome segregation ATPase